MTKSVVARRLLWAMTSLCLIVAVIAIPVVADGDDDEVRAGAGVTDGGRLPEPAEADRRAGAESVDGDPGDVAPGSAGEAARVDGPAAAGDGAPAPTATVPATTTLPPPDEGLGAAVDPGLPVAPRAGVYRYRTTGGGEGDGESTTRVEERGRSGDEVRLSVASAGGQLTTTSDVVWRPDGVRTLRSTLAFGDRSGDCDWEPDVVDAVFPLRAGATWRTETACQLTGLTPTPVTLQRTSSAKVLELRRTQVAGQAVDVWAIERIERLAGAGMSEEVTVVTLFSPKHGIDVDLRGTRGGEEYRRELLSLEPSPA